MDFTDKYFLWLNSLMYVDSDAVDMTDYQACLSYRSQLSSNHTAILLSESRLSLFMEDQKLLSAARDLIAATVKHLARLSALFLTETAGLIIDINRLNETNKQNLIHLQDLKTQAHRKYFDDADAAYKKVFPMSQDFLMLCRNFLHDGLK